MPVKRKHRAYARTLHDDKTGCIHCGQLVQIAALEVTPALLQIALFAW
jgi:hypothetical protein